MDPNVSELCVYDLTLAMVPAEGVAADLSHLNHQCKVKGYAFDKDDRAIDKGCECLTGCDLVLVPAGVPRKPGQDRKDLLNINAGIAKNVVEPCAAGSPESVMRLDGWLGFKCPRRDHMLVTELRDVLDKIMRNKIENPKSEFCSNARGIIGAVKAILEMDEDGKAVQDKDRHLHLTALEKLVQKSKKGGGGGGGGGGKKKKKSKGKGSRGGGGRKRG